METKKFLFNESKHHHPDDRKLERHHFPPHHHHHDYGVGSSLINLDHCKQHLSGLFKNPSDTAWAIRESTSEGPPHVQVRNSIILVQLAQVLEKIGISNGQTTVPVIGSSPRDYDFEYPIGLPEDVLEMIESEKQDEVAAWISEGPVHEVSMDLILINALAAINASLTLNKVENENNAK
ncbi:MAG: hypothetical protein JXB49_22850 [Bacteroidales bacterium]|nr:hypothetical protein [Bacteroidales bacterium]